MTPFPSPARPRPRRAARAALLAAAATLALAGECAAEAKSAEAFLAADNLAGLGALALQLLVVAAILQLGLGFVFESRWFVRHFEGRGVKSVVSFLGALALVAPFDLNLVAGLVGAVGAPPAAGGFAEAWSMALTALIVAGGASSVFRLFRAFGVRLPLDEARLADFERTGDFARVGFRVRTPAETGAAGERVSRNIEIYAGDELLASRTAPYAGGIVEIGTGRWAGLLARAGTRTFRVVEGHKRPGARQWTHAPVGIGKSRRVPVFIDMTAPAETVPEAAAGPAGGGA